MASRSRNPFGDGEEDKPHRQDMVENRGNGQSAFTKGSRYEPEPKFGHCTAVVGDKLFLWGGWSKGFPKVHTSLEKSSACLKVDVMNLNKGEWSQEEVYGDPPLGVRGYTTTTIDSKLYYFGGYCGHDWCRHNTLKCLDAMTMQWKDISCTNPQRSPMKKNACGMVPFKDSGEDYLFVFGGAGMLCSANEPEATYIPWKEDPNYGWTNEMHVFDLKTGDWVTPKITGDHPPPSAGFTLTQISPNTALFFGGFNPVVQECIKDVYKVELKRDSAHWSRVDITSPPDLRPRSRHDHTAVCISDGDQDPCVLVAGGRDIRWRSMGDVWVLNCTTGRWNKLNVPEGVAHRHFHSLSLYRINSQCVYAVMYGGVKEWERETMADDQPMLSDTTLIELGLSDEVWLVSAVLDSSMLTSTEEYKCRLIQHLFDTIRNSNKRGKGQPNNRRPDPAYEKTISDLHQQILSKDIRVNSLELQIQELINQLDNTQKELSQLQKQQNKVTTVQPQQATPSQTPPTPLPRPPPSQLSSAISRAITAEQIALEATEDSLKPFLVLTQELAISGAPIHKGVYGHTVVAKFKGCQVAARVLQQPPSSAFNKMVLTRELLKCSQIRHPNIVQFLGAVTDVGVVIVNELMATNLRYELEKKAFPKQEVLNVARDIALALAFLHQTSPRPIIHRAVFTQNIFLEPLALKWRAKVSDTILSNYFHYIGDAPDLMEPVYCPPEQSDPKSHTPKFDIYSLGVVLLEVLTRKVPPESEPERDKAVQSVKWAPMAELIKDCLTEEQSIRPTATRILEVLDSIQTK